MANRERTEETGRVQLLYLTELCTPAVNTCFSVHAICFLSPCCQDTLLTGGVYFFVSICNHIVRFFFFLLPARSLLSDSNNFSAAFLLLLILNSMLAFPVCFPDYLLGTMFYFYLLYSALH